MINGEVPFGHDFLQIAVGQGISQVPPNTQEDDHVFEMPSAEQCWPSSGHLTPYQIGSSRVCNRTVRNDLIGGEDALFDKSTDLMI